MKIELTTLEQKLLEKSSGVARIVLGRLKVRDRDGDLLEKGFVANVGEEAPVSIWNHSLIKKPGSKRAGVGTIWISDTEFGADVIFDDTPEGKATCERVLKERPDWSWGFPEPETRTPTKEEKAAGIKRVITKARVLELSPVDQGAGIAQGTLDACCGSCKMKGSCSHEGQPNLDGAQCKCAGSCSCGGGAAKKETDRDRNMRITQALTDAFATASTRIYLEDVESDAGALVYAVNPKEGYTEAPKLFRVTWEDGEDGITFGEPEEVRRTTSYSGKGEGDDEEVEAPDLTALDRLMLRNIKL